MGNVHGFFYFYFINEHVLRFFGQRYPHDYNKMPGSVYWLAHLVWLFPWSLFLPAAIAAAWKTRRNWLQHLQRDAGQTVDFYLDNAIREDVATFVGRLKFRVRTIVRSAGELPSAMVTAYAYGDITLIEHFIEGT